MSGLPRRLVLGIGGGIAAYKACELVRRLKKRDVDVRVVMTAGAEHFLGAATLQALSGQPVRTSLWDASAEAAMSHIELARWADAVLVAPASANVLARLAHGFADDLLTTLSLAASDRPLWLAPAMNRLMWAHPATQANVELLRARGAHVLGPASGEQACGEVGEGRMLEPEAIIAALSIFEAPQMLAGRRVLVSAGPTHEDLDPVRFLGNRSSGRMGFALAEAAAGMGAEVTLVAGPVALATPAGVDRIDVRSARQMHAAMLEHAPGMDVVIGAAAVADYRPEQRQTRKIKKQDDRFTVTLVRNPDILLDLAALSPRPYLAGFAAETEALEDNAQLKLQAKGLDLIAANLVGEGLGIETQDNALSVFWRGGSTVLPRAPKTDLAVSLLRIVAGQLAAKGGRGT